jgi:hypothetical protein
MAVVLSAAQQDKKNSHMAQLKRLMARLCRCDVRCLVMCAF